MAILTPVGANVVPGTGAKYYDAIAGEAITQGAACYIAPDNEAFLAVSTATPAAGANVKGIALNVASAGQPVRLQYDGDNTYDGDCVEGVIYVLSATAGAICPAADLTTLDRVVIVGVGTTTLGLRIHIYNSGVVI